jgi:uncharacterized protein YceH (UPF0502 family)
MTSAAPPVRSPAAPPPADGELQQRLAALETQVAALEVELAAVKAELGISGNEQTPQGVR